MEEHYAFGTCCGVSPDAVLRQRAMAYARDGFSARSRRALAALPRPADVPLAAAAVAAAVAIALLALPSIAWAGIFDQLWDSIANDFFGSGIEYFLNDMLNWLRGINADNIITGTFDGLFGDIEGAASIASFAETISETVVKPGAECILAVVVFTQFFKIAAEMDRNGGVLPGVREILKLLVVLSIFMFLVNNGFAMMRALFTVFQQFVTGVNDVLDASELQNIQIPDISDMDLIELFGLWALSVLLHALSFIVACIVQFIAIMRALLIYLYAMFSPLPFAFAGFDETRSWTLGYFKNFLAECLSGAIMLVVLYMFPLLINSAIGYQATDAGYGWMILLVSSELTLVFAMMRSGSIARSIIGGM